MKEETSKRVSDVPELLAAFDSNALMRPRFDVPGIVDFSKAVFHWAGIPNLNIGENANRIADAFADAQQLAIVVVDGLGMNFINKLEPSSFLRRHFRMELQTVFPSTTSSAFTSLSTAAWPNRHSIIGWDMYLDEVDSVATILRFERRHDGEPLDRLGIVERQAYPVPSLFSGFAGNLFSVVPDGIANTPYSDYWGGHNATYATYSDFANGVDKAISLSCVAKAPSIIYLYAIDVDYAAHEYGTNAKQTMDALQRIDRAIERLALNLPSDTRLLLTADHGHLDGRTHEILPSDPLVNHLVHEPWGDAREMHFAVKPGSEEEFETEFRGQYGEFAFLLTTDEVEALELFGPGRIEDAVRRRLGTHIAISRGADTFIYLAKSDPMQFIGYHSGLTPDEMLVPLIVV
ncbi:MAG: alkaline phosphatase family protein [Chloroflexota bacterium]|nr:alkaline phosphatase family protein [Chloroflexota bacterium]